MFLINGRKKSYLSVTDRATQFGDGSFTTARVIDGRICLCDAHLKRLQKDCKKLLIPFSQWDILYEEMNYIASHTDHGVLKVIISRGSSSDRGYSINNCFQPSRILSISPYPRHYDSWKNLGITLTLSPIRLGRNPKLAGIKHLNRLEQILIRNYLNHSNADESLVLDSEGMITECCAANLFWRKNNCVFTPRLDQAGVNGVMRQFCLSHLMNSPFRIVEIRAKPKTLKDADEIIICNSLISIVMVRAYKEKIWSSPSKLYQFLSPICERIGQI